MVHFCKRWILFCWFRPQLIWSQRNLECPSILLSLFPWCYKYRRASTITKSKGLLFDICSISCRDLKSQKSLQIKTEEEWNNQLVKVILTCQIPCWYIRLKKIPLISLSCSHGSVENKVKANLSYWIWESFLRIFLEYLDINGLGNVFSITSKIQEVKGRH